MASRLNRDIPGQMSDAELERLIELARSVPQNGIIVEVGSLYGLSSWHLSKYCAQGVTVFCIDPWQREKWIVDLVEIPQNPLHLALRLFLTSRQTVTTSLWFRAIAQT